ncbi:MAG: hypothetical protein AB1736_01295 [Chloroflexota bacterium]
MTGTERRCDAWGEELLERSATSSTRRRPSMVVANTLPFAFSPSEPNILDLITSPPV